MSGNNVDVADPFTTREGKTLRWRNVNMTVNKKGEDRKLLSEVWGEVPKRDVTAIMGPSGSGKTSLLNILAGRTFTKGCLTVESDVRLDSFPVDPTRLEVRKQVAFVAQDDSLQATSTPREAIKFSAKLRLPRSMTESQLDALTTKMLNELGLDSCADTYVGGAMVKGISGGERKRTSVGVELVTKPSLVFLDEPTSGLDSFSAMQLVQLLHKVAKAGSSVLFTIHQPTSEVFNGFDSLILLNKGEVMYQGSVARIPTYFAEHGYPMPNNHNPADWIMAIAQQHPQEDLKKSGFFESCNTAEYDEQFLDTKKVDALGFTMHSVDIAAEKDMRKVSLWTQIKLLYAREIRNLTRDKFSIATRLGITAFLNLLFGIIFQDVGRTSNADITNVQSHFGAIVMVLISAMFGSAQPALLAIPEERPLFLREYSTDHYSIIAYFLSRLTVEAFVTLIQSIVATLFCYFLLGIQTNFLLFLMISYALAMTSTAFAVLLGCSVSSPQLATELLPVLFVPQMLFAGFFVALQLVPSWLRWIQWICSLGYGVRLALVAEFRECAEGDDISGENCRTVLDNAEADVDAGLQNWLILGCLFVGTRIFALILLKSKSTF